MTWVAPLTWATDDLVTAAALNTNVRDNLGFLYSPPSCLLTHKSNQSLASGQLTVVNFDTAVVDTDGMHGSDYWSGFPETAFIEAQRDGTYVVSYALQVVSPVAGWFISIVRATPGVVSARIYEYASAAGRLFHGTATSLIRISEGQVAFVIVQVVNAPATGETWTLESSYPSTPRFSAVWVGDA